METLEGFRIIELVFGVAQWSTGETDAFRSMVDQVRARAGSVDLSEAERAIFDLILGSCHPGAFAEKGRLLAAISHRELAAGLDYRLTLSIAKSIKRLIEAGLLCIARDAERTVRRILELPLE